MNYMSQLRQMSAKTLILSGDMRTQMHQEAFPGEDISDRPPPEESVPGLLALIDGDYPSGRYQTRDLAERLAGQSTAS